MEFLQNIDTSLFYFINKTLANPVTDKAMPFITDLSHWLLFYILVLGYLLIKGGPKGRAAVIIAIVLIFFTDQANNLIKEWVGRVRPCSALPDVHLLVGCGSNYSFPSNHAVNNFAQAVMFSYFYPEMKAALFTAASLIAISRIFCGVHYPSDVLGGALFGILWGLLFVYIWKLLNKKLNIVKDKIVLSQ